MVTRQQIERLAQRIEGLAARQSPLAPIEHWYVDQGTARCVRLVKRFPNPNWRRAPVREGCGSSTSTLIRDRRQLERWHDGKQEVRSPASGPHRGLGATVRQPESGRFVWRDRGETEEQVLERHYADWPGDRAAKKIYVFSWRGRTVGHGDPLTD